MDVDVDVDVDGDTVSSVSIAGRSGEVDASGTRLSVQSGSTRADIGTVAAVLRSLTVGGVILTEPHDGSAPPVLGNGTVLAPWPNRVRDGRWIFNGASQQLVITDPESNSAIHGLLSNADYIVREHDSDSLTLGALIPPQQGWPFLLDTWVRYQVHSRGLTVTHGATNLGKHAAPWAVGGHPYLRMGEAAVDDLVLTVSAASYYEIDDRKLPTAERPVTDTPHDTRHGVRVADLAYDDAFSEISLRNGASAWLRAPDGGLLEILQDEDWACVQVFAPRDFPRPDGPGFAIAVEPMSAPADALNSGQRLQWLEPGGTSEGSWGLRYSPGSQ